MRLEKRNPDGVNVRVAADINSFGREIDSRDHTPDLIDLQAFRLRQRFRLSWPAARTMAEIAYANGRAA